MVGVPRSQGCRNCRRKKKGCDLKKPTCGQCARLNLTCGWDDKKWTFVSQEPGPSSELSNVPIRSRSSPDLTTRRESPTPPAGPAPRSLSRTAFEVASHDDFWSSFLPQEDPYAPDVGVHAATWAKTIRDLSNLDETVKVGISACALAILGRTSMDPNVLQEATRLYARALRDTNSALQDPLKAQSDTVLASCRVLAMYENFRLDRTKAISSQGFDWHKHVEGTCRIVELRGPEKHVAHHGHALFEEVRMTAIISGIALRRKNSFTTLEWHTVPWESSPRSLRDELYDLMIALPGILQNQDLILQKLSALETNRDRYSVLTDAQNHINRCVLIATSLRNWEEKALARCIQTSTALSEEFTGPVTLLEVCKDHGFGFFHVVMQFWAASLILYATTWVAYRNTALAVRTQQSESLPTLLRLPDIPPWMNPRPIASNLVRCLPHFFSEEAGFWGSQSAGFPMGATLHFLAATEGPDSDDVQRLRQQFDRNRLGKTTSDFLRSIASTPGKGKVEGDVKNRQQHRSMACSWFGTDVLQRNQSSSAGGEGDSS